MSSPGADGLTNHNPQTMVYPELSFPHRAECSSWGGRRFRPRFVGVAEVRKDFAI